MFHKQVKLDCLYISKLVRKALDFLGSWSRRQIIDTVSLWLGSIVARLSS